MIAIFQHNIKAGLGEIVTCIYEMIEVSKLLKNIGYTNILYINIIKNGGPCYFSEDNIFSFFNRNEIEKYFDNIEFNHISEKIINLQFIPKNINIYGSVPNKEFWDLFLENSNIDFDLSDYLYLNDRNIVPNYYDILNSNIIEKYIKVKKENYVSIHYRVVDGYDCEETYDYYENEIKNIINTNNLIFVCSNSYGFKKYIKSFNYDNVFMYDSPLENIYGNHYTNLLQLNENDKMIITETALIEMLILSQSNFNYLFSLWNIISSFVFLSNAKKVPKKLYLIPKELLLNSFNYDNGFFKKKLNNEIETI